ncbi:type I restriction enzyme HsdR N-terminal domain-containing protein [Fulvivirga maritima]|uniref:type I restriction enzyme HsdR N-terminal domain-containing protein n=1 Tax=Fulvivirga maritima TaxID=2904247 RepID=UPI001F1A9754|nr:type I restriction enzyme HsdR N-terminal domain-containing protein [Fulvivirga maritima]UII24580.1 type I restriction enzyme HsdR N-terminal domain-containing protein [Fulvivirga maritima]
MVDLNLPKIDFNIRKNEGKVEIFDIVRKKYVALTPEEWVRQHFVHFLVNEKGVF